MTPILFVNCSAAPYITDILRGAKKYETRSSDTLRQLVGKHVLLAETGRGRPIVVGSAVIGEPIVITDADAWEILRDKTCVPHNAPHDWKATTKRKYLYPLSDVQQVAHFAAPEGIRHGRVWMEYEEEKTVYICWHESNYGRIDRYDFILATPGNDLSDPENIIASFPVSRTCFLGPSLIPTEALDKIAALQNHGYTVRCFF